MAKETILFPEALAERMLYLFVLNERSRHNQPVREKDTANVGNGSLHMCNGMIYKFPVCEMSVF
jgi:hypothetical protein